MNRPAAKGGVVTGTFALAFLILVAALPSVADAKSTGAPTSPGPGWGPNMVYDAKDGYLIMFGGSSHGNQSWKFFDGKWTLLNLSVAPPARSYAGITYDAADGYVLLFGGRCGSCDDTWKFSGGKWTDISSTVGHPPSARESMGMVYDAADGYVVLFGGFHGGHAYNDTWEFVKGTWKNVTGTTGLTPPGRMGQGIAYDATDGYVVMYGGWLRAAHLLNDTWEFLAGRWTPLSPAKNPGPKWWPGMTFDSTDGYVLLFAGIINVDKAWWTTPADSWKFVGGQWTNITNLSNSPTQRFGEGLANDPAVDGALMFGGLNSTDVVAHALSDTWMYGGGVWTDITKTA